MFSNMFAVFVNKFTNMFTMFTNKFVKHVREQVRREFSPLKFQKKVFTTRPWRL